jgi:hypothetical protein
MDKEDHLSQRKANKKLTPKTHLNASYREALENELWESLNKLEHRVEILRAISCDQRASECYELAKVYRKQAMETKVYA